MTKQFEVSADWMLACGYGHAAYTSGIVKTEDNLVGGQGFDSFVTILDPNGHPWVLAVARGRFVEVTTEPTKVDNGAHISRTWNAILDKGRNVVATSKGDVFMRVVRIRSKAGVLQGRATNGEWIALPADALFRVTP